MYLFVSFRICQFLVYDINHLVMPYSLFETFLSAPYIIMWLKDNQSRYVEELEFHVNSHYTLYHLSIIIGTMDAKDEVSPPNKDYQNIYTLTYVCVFSCMCVCVCACVFVSFKLTGSN